MASFIVGLTGGIGSGKSAVSERFAKLAVEIADADVANRQVVAPGTDALNAIVERHGRRVLRDGALDRATLRELIFADPDERRWLEQLINPLIGRYLNQALADACSPYAILVNPVLIETGHYRICSRVLVVDVSEALQIKRTMARDLNSEDQVKAILAAQASREARLAKADDVIVNQGSLADLDAKVGALHEKFLRLAQREPSL